MLEVCWPSAVLEAAKALYAEAHNERPFHDGSPERFVKPQLHWSKTRSASFPFHAADGAAIHLTDVEPEGADYRWMGVAGDSAAEHAPAE